ncbi:MAG: hypothetical protein ACYSUS_05515 [Planctomycetota bacterium]
MQRFGPKHLKSQKALEVTLKQIEKIVAASQNRGDEAIIFGDYAITETPNGAVFPNKILLEAGFFKTRSVNSMLYPDLYGSRAFAMVDHQIAHVYIKDKTNIATIKDTLSETIGIEKGACLYQR